MILDALQIEPGTVLSADVAVVGAGPAGIVTALELAGHGLDVLILESGRDRFDARAQRLADAAKWSPKRHAPMSMATRRQVGGASVIWGGRCVPYDAIDFERRDGRSAWPVAYDDLVPLFQRACDWLACGRPAFDRRTLSHLPESLVPGLPDQEVRTSTFERWSLPTDFGREYGDRLRRSRKVRLVTGLTCTKIACKGDERRVDHLQARGLDGRRLRVQARRYVLACGGLETTRLLLASPGPHDRALGDHSGHLGRWYMGHVEGGVARVRFSTPPQRTIFGYERDVDGVYVRRRISFGAEAQRRLGLPNIVAWLANPDLADPEHRNGALSLAYLALTSPLGRLFAPDAQRLSLTGHDVPGAPYGPTDRGPTRDHLRNLVQDARSTARFIGGFGIPRFLPPARRAPGFFVYDAANSYPLQFHGEHLPSRDSRVTLSDERDGLGVPKLSIDIRFSDEDVEGVVRAHRHLDEHLRRHGCGRLEYMADDVAAAVSARLGGGFHQLGVTRMSAHPEDGVLTPDLAVHGFDDLFVVSSSAFVTSSQANSTFMIVVFALRLADRLRAEMSAGQGQAPQPGTSNGGPAAPRSAVVTGRPLRLVLTTARYLPERGGTEIHTHQVAQRLAGFGADVTVLSTAPEEVFVRESREGPVRVVRVRAWPPGRDYYLAPELVRVIRSTEADLVHCHGYHTLVAPMAMLAALSAGIPYVVTLHSGGHSSRLRRSIRPLQAWLLRPLLRRARQLIAVSQFEAELFARRVRLPPSSFVVIPSGVDLPLAPLEDSTAGPPLVLSIGRLEAYKGHQRVLEALPALDRARPGTRLRVVGTGPYEPDLRRLAERLGVAHLLDIAPVPAERRDEMARLLQRAGCVAMLSEYESQGVAIQEALGAGRPILVSDTTALGELRQHTNVRVVSRWTPGDEIASVIIELLDAPPVAPPPLPTWDECAAALLDLYLEVLAGRS
jgi:choline dehydrogenase-like flavoprotein/glycosyltransferase involved in cell wall biosynthesis